MRCTQSQLSEFVPGLKNISQQSLLQALRAMDISVSVQEDSILAEIPRERPDLSCLSGLARTAAAALGLTFVPPSTEVPPSDQGSIFERFSLDVYTESCLRLSAAMAVHCHVEKSPRWLQETLEASGIASNNNLTDIASLVRLETGIPVTLLDLRQLPEALILRDAFPDEILPRADGTSLALEPGMPLFSDENGQLLFPAGTEDSCLPEDCTEVLLLSGVYDPQILGTLQKDFPSAAMERNCLSLDPMAALPALLRACCLISSLSWGNILDGVLDNLNYVPQPEFLPVPEGLTRKEQEALLTLGFRFSENMLELPSFRRDLKTPEDLKNVLSLVKNSLH